MLLSIRIVCPADCVSHLVGIILIPPENLLCCFERLFTMFNYCNVMFNIYRKLLNTMIHNYWYYYFCRIGIIDYILFNLRRYPDIPMYTK